MGKIIPIILCGGSGTRLSPLSKLELPKQFLNLIEPHKSLLQKTFERALFLTGVSPSDIVIVTSENHAHIVQEQLKEFIPHILTEKMPRNTAAAIALAGDFVSNHFSLDTTMFVMPSDAHIGNETALRTALLLAGEEAERNKISVFGITPHRPETGYGYIKKGEALSAGIYSVKNFVEKPDHETALTYLVDGNYLWNSGMSVFKTSIILEEFEKHAPFIYNNINNYENLPNLSFDVAILEKTAKLSVVECNPEWSDIGSWRGLWEILEKNGGGTHDIGGVSVYDLARFRIA